MKRIIPKKEWDRRGVSEVVGNLLILAITVTLFSSVMWFVTSMPTPDEDVHVDFSSNLELNENTGVANITIIHKGGQTLENFKTNIYLFKNDTYFETLSLTQGGVGEKWETGEIFRYQLTGISQSTSLSVMIVDTEANSLVWDPPVLWPRTAVQSKA